MDYDSRGRPADRRHGAVLARLLARSDYAARDTGGGPSEQCWHRRAGGVRSERAWV